MEHGCCNYALGQDVLRILQNQERMMAAIDDLRTKVAELQATVDADQASDAAVVAALQAEIDRLNGELAAGATGEQLAEIAASLDTIKSDVAGPNA